MAMVGSEASISGVGVSVVAAGGGGVPGRLQAARDIIRE
jgi:hypothetical protein